MKFRLMGLVCEGECMGCSLGDEGGSPFAAEPTTLRA